MTELQTFPVPAEAKVEYHVDDFCVGYVPGGRDGDDAYYVRHAQSDDYVFRIHPRLLPMHMPNGDMFTRTLRAAIAAMVEVRANACSSREEPSQMADDIDRLTDQITALEKRNAMLVSDLYSERGRNLDLSHERDGLADEVVRCKRNAVQAQQALAEVQAEKIQAVMNAEAEGGNLVAPVEDPVTALQKRLGDLEAEVALIRAQPVVGISTDLDWPAELHKACEAQVREVV